MQTQIQDIDGFQVSGLQVRTRNADETNPSTAKIGPMWGQFFARQLADTLPNKAADAKIYGVYSNYQSDASGEFDAMAGAAVSAAVTTAITADGFATVNIKSGKYLVFACEGEMPMAVIQGWGKVWSYFNSNTEHERCYQTDFEEYLGPQQAAIYIGIK
ncbi:GyrI-like domain-containing protein [Undibacterium sp. CY18W]|uniref:GyrI-like domain-containing protein n=1 Tax=Undibacterium hunanense TaxID=2762292 RepID=A0ABR6ZRU6_9BURK|nr:GyrI-like domain-containing protein [Undibacterium hunanense]MBC3918595.1 GyrI-like domain-containing protein [Undibacterium hunanense]